MAIGTIQGATMVHRMLTIFVVALALTVGAWGCRNTATTHQGKVVEVGAGTLAMTDPAGANQHTHNANACGYGERRGASSHLAPAYLTIHNSSLELIINLITYFCGEHG